MKDAERTTESCGKPSIAKSTQSGPVRAVRQQIKQDELNARCKPWKKLRPVCLSLSAVMLLIGAIAWCIVGLAKLYAWLPITCFSVSAAFAVLTVAATFFVDGVLKAQLPSKKPAGLSASKKIVAVTLLACSVLSVAAVSIAVPLVSNYDGRSDGFCYNLNKDNTVQIVAYQGKDSQVTVPARIDGKRVVSVQGFGKTDVTGVNIANGVLSVGDRAFSDCVSLKEITLADSVTSIGSSAFEGCTALASVTVPNRVAVIGRRAFADCTSLKTLAVGNNVARIGGAAFANCVQLTDVSFNAKNCDVDGQEGVFYNAGINTAGVSVTFGSAVDKVPAHLFAGNGADSSLHYDGSANVADIKFAAGSVCKSIGQCAFQDTPLVRVQLPASLKEIGAGAFRYCANLTEITLPDGVTSIGTSAFYGCTALAHVTVPKNVTTINYSTFSGCSGLASVTLPDGLLSIGDSAFYGCGSLTEIAIPNGVTYIGAYAFGGCSAVKSFSIPVGVTKIADYAFQYCSSLTDMIIGDNIKSIGKGAFFFCSDLEKVVIPNSVKSVGRDAFDACRFLTLYCQADSKPDGWDTDWNSDGRPVVWRYTEDEN